MVVTWTIEQQPHISRAHFHYFDCFLSIVYLFSVYMDQQMPNCLIELRVGVWRGKNCLFGQNFIETIKTIFGMSSWTPTTTFSETPMKNVQWDTGTLSALHSTVYSQYFGTWCTKTLGQQLRCGKSNCTQNSYMEFFFNLNVMEHVYCSGKHDMADVANVDLSWDQK